MKRLVGCAFLLASACAGSTPHVNATRISSAQHRVYIDETTERAWLGPSGSARLVDLGGDERRGTTLTIHGINAAPGDIADLSNAGLLRGERVLSMVYDDNFRRLQLTADDFARHVDALQSALPRGTRLRIDAHSMGARAVVVAIDRLRAARRAFVRPVELHLISPLLAGIRAANPSWMTPILLPFGLSTLVKNAEPARDLAQDGDFQREVEAARFPAGVRVAITLPEHDRFAQSSVVLKLAERWRASVQVLPGTTHMSVPRAAAASDHPRLFSALPAGLSRRAAEPESSSL